MKALLLTAIFAAAITLKGPPVDITPDKPSTKNTARVICVEGLEFLVVYAAANYPVAVVQVYEYSLPRPQPKTCN